MDPVPFASDTNLSTEYAVPDVTKSSLAVAVPPPPTVPFHPNIYGEDAPPPPLPPHPYGTFPNIQVLLGRVVHLVACDQWETVRPEFLCVPHLI